MSYFVLQPWHLLLSILVVRKLFEDANGRTLPLLFAARDRSCHHAVVLLDDLNVKRQGAADVAI